MPPKNHREKFVETTLAKMSLDDKLGQCLTFEFHGTVVTPTLRHKISKLGCGGLRATPHVNEGIPYGLRKSKEADIQRRAPWAGPAEYAQVINELQNLALERGAGIPLMISIDFEGDMSADFAKGGMHLLPSQMGMHATDDIKLATQAWRIIARQLRAVGINMVHSPCVDIDFVPNNPAIGVRAFGDTPEVCAAWGIALAKAFKAEGVIAAAKHYLGLGFSKVDTHFSLDVNERSLEQLQANELYPYKRLITAGLSAIMVAHTMYKAVDPDGVPATASRKVVDFTRQELGFDGVLVTDSTSMNGLLNYFGGEMPKAACATLKAGCDSILIKTTEDMEIACWEEVKRAVINGELPVAELDQHVRRILRLKYDHGLFDAYPVNVKKATAAVHRPANKAVIAKVAAKCCTLLCDDEQLLPLKPEQKVLVVEPYFPLLMDRGNDFYWHSSMLQEYLSAYSPNIGNYEIVNGGTEEDLAKILDRSAHYDICVVICQKFRSFPSTSPIAEKLLAAGRKVVVLSANPYEMSIPAAAKCVVVTYGQVPPLLKNAADVLYGKTKLQGHWPLANYTSPFDKVGVKKAR